MPVITEMIIDILENTDISADVLIKVKLMSQTGTLKPYVPLNTIRYD